MGKYFFLVMLGLAACESSVTPFCECINTSEVLNNAQIEFMEKIDETTTLDSKEMIKLREAKKLACKEFESISGEEALELKKACEDS